VQGIFWLVDEIFAAQGRLLRVRQEDP